MKNTMYILLIGLFSCGLIFEDDDELHIPKKENNSGKLRLDGVYIKETVNSEGPLYSRWFFFKNGIVNQAGATNSLRSLGPPYNVESKDDWGLYIIEGNKIKIEKWYLASSNGIGTIPYYANTREGKILNDSTFEINKSYRIIDGKETSADQDIELFKFYSISPKPDSVLAKPYIK